MIETKRTTAPPITADNIKNLVFFEDGDAGAETKGGDAGDKEGGESMDGDNEADGDCVGDVGGTGGASNDGDGGGENGGRIGRYNLSSVFEGVAANILR